MSTTLQTISPIDGSVYVERSFANTDDIQMALEKACNAQKVWKKTPLAERKAICTRATDALVAK